MCIPARRVYRSTHGRMHNMLPEKAPMYQDITVMHMRTLIPTSSYGRMIWVWGLPSILLQGPHLGLHVQGIGLQRMVQQLLCFLQVVLGGHEGRPVLACLVLSNL